MKFLSIKFLLTLLFFFLVTSVSANEGIRLYQFNKHIEQAKQLKASQDYQGASKTLQEAKDALSSTLVLKSLKKEETQKIENEIKKLAEEKTEEAISVITPSPITTLSPTEASVIINEPIKEDEIDRVKKYAGIKEEIERVIKEKRDNDREENEKSNYPSPSLSPSPSPSPSPQESYTYDSYYPIILSFSDNVGSLIKYSGYNGYQGSYRSNQTNITLKIGDTIRWKAEASDPKDRQILYNFHSDSNRFNNEIGIENGKSKFTPNNEIEYTITEEDLKTAGETLRIVVQIKSDKEYLRSPGASRDDYTFLDYILRPAD